MNTYYVSGVILNVTEFSEHSLNVCLIVAILQKMKTQKGEDICPKSYR